MTRMLGGPILIVMMAQQSLQQLFMAAQWSARLIITVTNLLSHNLLVLPGLVYLRDQTKTRIMLAVTLVAIIAS